MISLNKKLISSGLLMTVMLSTSIVPEMTGLQIHNNQIAKAATGDASAVNLADMANPALENAKVVNLDDLGADPTGLKDSFSAWEKALKMSEAEPIRLKLSPGGKYLLDVNHNIEVLASKGIYLDGQGATLLPKNTKPDQTDPASAQLYETYVASVKMVKGSNAGFKMDNLNIDGSRNPNNLFFTFQDGKWSGYDTSGIAISGLRKTRLMRGFHIENAEKLDVADSKFENLFAGYTLLLENYRKVNINNLTLDKVGGDGQTDSLGMGLYFAGHTFDDTEININNFKMIGNLGNGPQSNPWTGVSNPGDPSYTSWIGIVIENGSIQANDPSYWKVDKNTTLNVTNSQIDNVEHTFHVESMAGNVAVNFNNVKSHAKAFGISAGIKGKYQFTGNKLDIELLPYGRNGLYATMFSSEFGDDPRYHNGYNANLTDASGGAPMHSSLVANSKVTFVPGEKSLVDKNFGESYATVDYGNMVNGNFECTQFDNLPNKLFANGGGYMKDVVINLADINTNTATFAGIKGDPGAAGVNVKEENVTVNAAGAWTSLTQTCTAPQFVNFSGTAAPILDSAVTPAPIGGGGTTTEIPTTEAPLTEKPTTEAPATTEKPTTEAPATTEKPTTEAPATTEKPTTEAPATTEKPTTEAPATTEKPTTETPATTEKPTTEAPATTEKPTTEAPATTEKPTTEKPTTEKPTTEEPTIEELTTESTVGEPVDVTTEDVTTEDITTEDVTTEDITTEDVTTEDVTTEDVTTEDVTTEDITTEDITSEDVTTEDVTTEDVTTEEAIEEIVKTVTNPDEADKDILLDAGFTWLKTLAGNTHELIIPEGSDFDPRKGLEAYDLKDQDITSDVKILENNVDPSKSGTYHVTYSVKDSDGYETIIRDTVIVKTLDGNISTEDVTTENATTENATTEDVSTENTTNENVIKDNVSTENTTTENVTKENVSTENVTTEDASSENISKEDVSTEKLTTEDASLENSSPISKVLPDTGVEVAGGVGILATLGAILSGLFFTKRNKK